MAEIQGEKERVFKSATWICYKVHENLCRISIRIGDEKESINDLVLVIRSSEVKRRIEITDY